jgi:hypothetical protein
MWIVWAAFVTGVGALGYYLAWWFVPLVVFVLPLLWHVFGPTDRR